MLPNKSFFCYLRRQGASSDMRKEELRLLLIYRGRDRGWKVKRSGEWKSQQSSTYRVKASAVVQDGLPLQLIKSVPGLFPSIPWRQPRLHDGPRVEYRMEENHPDPSIPPMICSQAVLCIVHTWFLPHDIQVVLDTHDIILSVVHSECLWFVQVGHDLHVQSEEFHAEIHVP